MKAAIFRRHGGPEVLETAESPDPSPRPNEVVLSIKACALNHLDVWVRQGIPGARIPMPHVLGSDVCGVTGTGDLAVVAPGAGCRVCEACLAGKESLCDHYQLLGFQRQGGYAEKIAVDSRDVIPVSKKLTPVEWAAVPLVFLTAWHMLVTRAKLQAGETVLIHAAGSGIGSAAIQIAKYLGSRVITTASTDAKLSKAKSLGADDGINYAKEPNFSKAVMELTQGRGVDVVFEHIGGEVFAESVDSLAKEGRLVFCGATTGDTATIVLRQAYLRHLTFHGSFMGGRGELLQILKLVETGSLRPVVDSTFPLERARAAHEKMLSRDVFGKIVLQIP
ncbi:MAG TPA: zinc-binding dehydrogenase [bacterium]|nr:zinc-binding dehydrogenase [bacterium]